MGSVIHITIPYRLFDDCTQLVNDQLVQYP